MIKEFKTVLKLGSIILFVGTLLQILFNQKFDFYTVSTGIAAIVFGIAYTVLNTREKKK